MQEYNNNTKSPFLLLNIGFVLIIFFSLSTILLRFSERIELIIIPLLLETVSFIVMFVVYRNELIKFNFEIKIIESCKKNIFQFSAIQIFISIGLLILSSSINHNETSIYYYFHDGFVFIISVSFLLFTYLSEEDIFELEEEKFLEKEQKTNDKYSFEDAIYDKYPTHLSSWIDKVELKFHLIEKRIGREEFSSKQKARVNLIVGSAIAFLGLLILLYFIIDFKKSPIQDSSLLLGYLSKLSLVIFVEIFALFFLKLYKSNITEIRYYENEMTNIEMKYIALLSAKESNNIEAFSKVITDFSITERNSILKDGESTVNLQQKKLDDSSNIELMNRFISIIDKLKN